MMRKPSVGLCMLLAKAEALSFKQSSRALAG